MEFFRPTKRRARRQSRVKSSVTAARRAQSPQTMAGSVRSRGAEEPRRRGAAPLLESFPRNPQPRTWRWESANDAQKGTLNQKGARSGVGGVSDCPQCVKRAEEASA